MNKLCTKCKKVAEHTRTGKFCRACISIKNKEYAARMPSRTAQKQAWKDRNPEKVRESRKKEYANLSPEKRRDNERRYRARKKQNFVEFVDERIVFDRDKWICQLCYNEVDPKLSYPDPLSKSLDHKIPLCAGGPHSYANTQLAHLRCNNKKSGKLAHEADIIFV